MKIDIYLKSIIIVFVLTGLFFTMGTKYASAGPPLNSFVIECGDGGGCPDWNADTRTCVLNDDVAQTNGSFAIDIDCNHTTLDCRGFTINANDRDGIRITNQSDVTVKDCNIVGDVGGGSGRDGNQGIDVLKSGEINILSNDISDFIDGIRLDNVTGCYVSNNTLTDSGSTRNGTGIHVDGGRDIWFVGNLVANSSNGIQVEGCNHCNFISNDSSGNTNRGFFLIDVTNSTFITNTANDSVLTSGFRLFNSNSNLFHKNYANANGNGGFTDAGFFIDDSDNNTLIYNFIDGENAQRDGIRVVGDSHNNIIRDNIIVNNIDDPIDDGTTSKSPKKLTANTYINNLCDDASEPAGLCDDVL